MAWGICNVSDAITETCRDLSNQCLACLPLPLHLEMAEDPPSLPVGQPRLGVPEVWTVKRWRRKSRRIHRGGTVHRTGSCCSYMPDGYGLLSRPGRWERQVSFLLRRSGTIYHELKS